MMPVPAADLLRAAHGERVPGVTHSHIDGTPLGPGPLTPDGWCAFDAARQHGFLTTTDAAAYGALFHLWRHWCTAHDLPEVMVSTRQMGRRGQERAGSRAPDRVADVALTLDHARRVLAPAGLLAVAEALVWAGESGQGDACRWFTSPDLVRVSAAPVATVLEFGAALLRIGQDARLTCPGPYADQDPDALRAIAERRHGG